MLQRSLLATLLLFVCGSVALAQTDLQITPDKARELILQSIQVNHSKIAEGRAAMKLVMLNTESRLEDEQVESPNGAIIVFAAKPARIEKDITLLFKGNQTYLEVQSNNSTVKELFNGKFWTTYIADSASAWMRPEGETPGGPEFDPRYVGVVDRDTPFDQLIAQSEMVRAAFVTMTNGPELRVDMQHPTIGPVTAVFPSEFGYLPTRVCYLSGTDGSVTVAFHIKYRGVDDRGAFFPTSWDMTMYRRGMATVETGSDQFRLNGKKRYRQKITVTVIESDFVNNIANSAFDLQLPTNTRIFDAVNRRYSNAPQNDNPTSYLWWLVSGIVVALVVGFSVKRIVKHR